MYNSSIALAKQKIPSILKVVILAILGIITIYPLVWMAATSLKLESDIVKFPPRLLPDRLTIAAYIDIWKRIPFTIYYKNSIIFAGGVTAVSLFLDSSAGYAFARLNFKGRNILFLLVLSTLMIPFQVTMIPIFVEVYKLGLLNTFAGLIIPRASNAFGIFMMRQFFITLPKDIEEAARVDGCNEFKIYWKIMIPLCKPAIASVAIFHFMYNWNDLLYPLLLTSSNEMRPLPAGLALFMGKHVIEYAILMAGACLALAPILIAYIFSQKYFIKGIAMTGIKG